MKRVRILLRVSSNQQLEKDGDLTVQRELVLAYVKRHSDWLLDDKEYFEGSNSGFKNAVSERDVLQEALDDAKENEYDILIVYKDDRIGRRMWEIGAYINQLKQCGVDVYTTVDDCISPEADDMMGQMMLAFRYNVAEKSSRDTGVRVRDSARELVKTGKFMGGKAPYGYELCYSGAISKHGRALKKLVINSEKAETVQYIYELYLYKGYGDTKIAKILNADQKTHQLAPLKDWKAGTIASILTNPVYAGYVAYNRRQRTRDGGYHRLGSEEWITANECNVEIQMIQSEVWNKAQEERKRRRAYYQLKKYNLDATPVKTSHVDMILLDVIRCGYCGGKLTNATKYNYWTIKDTGERRKSKVLAYRCVRAWQGETHGKSCTFRGDEIDQIVLDEIEKYMGELQREDTAYSIFVESQLEEKRRGELHYKKCKDELVRLEEALQAMLDKVPEAIHGNYPLSIEDLNMAISRQREKIREQKERIKEEERVMASVCAALADRDDIASKVPTWIEVLHNCDCNAKRMLVNRLIERVEVTREQIVIRFRIALE